ncbi:MAG: hypothetical protein U0531_08230 [Dehalococcoidia bacterium]
MTLLLSPASSFVTGGPHADLLLTVANVTDSEGGPMGTAILIVLRAAPGRHPAAERTSWTATVHGEFELRDVAVPAGDVLGEIGKGCHARWRISPPCAWAWRRRRPAR